jgi:hypothetical protein
MDMLTLNGGTFSAYNWSTGETTPTIVIDGGVLGAGTYTFSLEAVDANDCNNTDEIIITVSICIGIDELNRENAMSIYPNPATGMVTIEVTPLQNEQLFVEVMDIQGRQIHQSRITAAKITLDLSDQPKGLYIVKMYSERRSELKKLILN